MYVFEPKTMVLKNHQFIYIHFFAFITYFGYYYYYLFILGLLIELYTLGFRSNASMKWPGLYFVYILKNEWPRYLVIVNNFISNYNCFLIELKCLLCFKLIWILINLLSFILTWFSYHNALEYFYLREIVRVRDF